LICYDVKNQLPDDKSDLEILDWLACGEAEPKAPVAAATVEHAANAAVQHWCRANKAAIEAVSKLSAIYLLPKRTKTTSARQLLTAVQKNLRATHE